MLLIFFTIKCILLRFLQKMVKNSCNSIRNSVFIDFYARILKFKF